MEINIVIRELLAKHTFISLPGIGSFVQKYEPAHLSDDGITFTPPRQYVVFDIARNFNDEAIENYLIDKLGIDHKKASEILNDFIDNVKKDLNSGKEILFENVGTLVQDKIGNITFKQISDLELATETYGLGEVKADKQSTSKIQEKKTGEAKKPTPTIIAEQKSNLTKVIVGIAAFIAVAAIVSALIFIPDLRFWSRKEPVKTVQTLPVNDTTKQDSSKIARQEVQNSAPTDTVKQKVDQTIINKNEKKAALYYEEPKKQENRTFYLIVGSFSKLENAQKLSEKYSQKGFTTEIVEGNNMYRVSILKTMDKNRALGEYNKFKTENPNEAAWILGV